MTYQPFLKICPGKLKLKLFAWTAKWSFNLNYTL